MDYPSKDLSEAQSIVLRDLVTLGLVRVGARVRVRIRARVRVGVRVKVKVRRQVPHRPKG